VKANTLQELLALAKASPGTIAYGTPGNGLAQHFAGEQLKLMAKVDMVHVPYRGASPAINDLVGGQIPVAIVSPASIAPMIAANRAKALAVTGKARLPRLANVPTVAESGFPDYEINEWYGVAAPASMPAANVQRLNQEIAKIFAAPDRQAWLAEMSMQDGFGSAESFAAFIRTEITRLGEIAEAANIKND
jgi:tripartite-type tricarboxylate transporter receptor subunit TctC